MCDRNCVERDVHLCQQERGTEDDANDAFARDMVDRCRDLKSTLATSALYDAACSFIRNVHHHGSPSWLILVEASDRW